MVHKPAEDERLQGWFSAAGNCSGRDRRNFCGIMCKGVDDLKGATERKIWIRVGNDIGRF